MNWNKSTIIKRCTVLGLCLTMGTQFCGQGLTYATEIKDSTQIQENKAEKNVPKVSNFEVNVSNQEKIDGETFWGTIAFANLKLKISEESNFKIAYRIEKGKWEKDHSVWTKEATSYSSKDKWISPDASSVYNLELDSAAINKLNSGSYRIFVEVEDEFGNKSEYTNDSGNFSIKKSVITVKAEGNAVTSFATMKYSVTEDKKVSFKLKDNLGQITVNYIDIDSKLSIFLPDSTGLTINKVKNGTYQSKTNVIEIAKKDLLNGERTVTIIGDYKNEIRVGFMYKEYVNATKLNSNLCTTKMGKNTLTVNWAKGYYSETDAPKEIKVSKYKGYATYDVVEYSGFKVFSIWLKQDKVAPNISEVTVDNENNSDIFEMKGRKISKDGNEKFQCYTDRSNSTIKIKANDGKSGIYNCMISDTNNKEDAKTVKEKDGTYQINVKVNSDSKKIYVWLEDYCGNESKTEIEILKDEDAPSYRGYELTNDFKHYNIGNNYEFWKKDDSYSIYINAVEMQKKINVVYHVFNQDGEEVYTSKEEELEAIDSKEHSDRYDVNKYLVKINDEEFNELKNGKYTIKLSLSDDYNNLVNTGKVFSFKFETNKAKFNSIDIKADKVWMKPSNNDGNYESVKAKVFSYLKMNKMQYTVTFDDEVPKDWQEIDTSYIAKEDGTEAEIDFHVPTGKLKKEGTYKCYFWIKDYNGNVCSTKSITYYVDGNSPVLSKFKCNIKSATTSASKRLFKFLFGSFVKVKDDITFSVNAEDYYGVDSVKMYYVLIDNVNALYGWNNEQIYNNLENLCAKSVKMDCEGNSFSCKLSIPEKSKFYKIYFVAKDKAGNITIENIGDLSGKSSLMMIDDDAPKLYSNRNANGNNSYIQEVDEEERIWYAKNSEILYNLQVTDNEAGIFSVSASINGEDVTTDYYGNEFHRTLLTDENRVTNLNYTIGINQGEISKIGKYNIKFFAEDNAGNKNSIEKNVYIDEDAPVISEVKMKDQTDDMEVVPIQYGYFFKKQEKIKVVATDYVGETSSLGSGVKSITCIYKSVDNQKTFSEVHDNIESNVDGKYITYFDIPKGYKGQFEIYATDNVEQKSETVNPKGAVVESLDMHKKMSDIEIKLPETKFRDLEGNYLFDSPIEIGMKGSDTRAGIASLKWELKGYYSAEPVQSENVSIGSKYDLKKQKWIGTCDSTTNWKLSKDLDLNLVTEAQRTLRFSEDVNHLTTEFSLTDNVDYKLVKKSKVFSIDTIDPLITVEYSGKSENEKYYKEPRVATVTIEDANFSPDKVEFITTGPKPVISGWSHTGAGNCDGKVHNSKCKYSCTVTFQEDGEYSFTVKCEDLAGHKSEYGQTDEFTIDKTKPEINVTYSNEKPMNGKYYKTSRTATVTVKDKNFDSSRTTVNIESKGKPNGGKTPGASGFSQNGDSWTSTINFNSDGVFKIRVNATDKAGNEGEKYEGEEFVIDLTEPKIKIVGVEKDSANNGVVAPKISFEDTNINTDSVKVSLKGVNTGSKNWEYKKSSGAEIVNLQMVDIKHEKANDDLYTIEVKIADKAGNEKSEKRTFSVNRFGSVYILNSATKKLVDKFYTNEEQELVVTEVNVDTLEKKVIESSLDSNTYELVENRDFSVTKDVKPGRWKTYQYRVNKENFQKEGNYVISFFSQDRATNKSSNRTKGTDISFVVDKTAPSIVLSGVEDGRQYMEVEKQIFVDAKDNILLDSVTVYKNGKVCIKQNRDELLESNGELKAAVISSHDNQNVYVEAVDVAGNVYRSENRDFLLTTNLFVQWYSNKMLAMGTVSAFATIAILTSLLKTRRKRSRR